MRLREIVPTRAGQIDFDAIEDALRLEEPILLRGHKLDLTGFEDLTHRLCGDFHEVGTRQALRRQAGDGLTTEVFRSNFILLGHSEGMYRPFPAPPDLCFFMCVQPPAQAGGETTIIDGHEMLERLPSQLRHRLESCDITYECLWGQARWQAEFGVNDTDALVRLLGTFPSCRYDLNDGFLHLFYATRAVTRSRAGTPVFANGVLAHLPSIAHPSYAGRPVYCNPANKVLLGEGDAMPDEVVNALIDAHDRVLARHRWEADDILILDNTRHMHGREMTAAPCDRVLISRFGRLESRKASSK